MLEPEMNGYPPNVKTSSLSKDGAEVNNPVVNNEGLSPFIGNANIQNVPVFKSKNYIPGVSGWALFEDGTSDGIAATIKSYCRVYLTSDKTITAGGARKILFDTKTYDNLSEFDITTNNRFTATNAGNYLVNAICKFDPSAADVFYSLQIQRNGATVAQKDTYSLTSGTWAIQVTDIVALTAGQYIEIFVDSTEGSDYTVKGTTSRTFLDIHRLS